MAPTSMVQEVGTFVGKVGVGGRKLQNCAPGGLPIHLFIHFCCRMYRYVLISHKTIRHRQAERQQYHANSQSHCTLAVRSATKTMKSDGTLLSLQMTLGHEITASK